MFALHNSAAFASLFAAVLLLEALPLVAMLRSGGHSTASQLGLATAGVAIGVAILAAAASALWLVVVVVGAATGSLNWS